MLKNPLASLKKMEQNSGQKFIWKVKKIDDPLENAKGNNFLILIRYGNSNTKIMAESEEKVILP